MQRAILLLPWTPHNRSWTSLTPVQCGSLGSRQERVKVLWTQGLFSHGNGMWRGVSWAAGCPGLYMAIVAEQLTPRNRTADANYETLVSSCNYEASITINIRNYAHWPALVITLPKLLCPGVWRSKTIHSRHQKSTHLGESLVLLVLKYPRCLTNMQILSPTSRNLGLVGLSKVRKSG